MKVLVVGCSLNPHSYSQVLAREVTQELRGLGVEPRLLDLREQHLPLCDGGNAAEPEPWLTQTVAEADAILLTMPVYNYSVSAAAKNLVELTGQAWRDKVVGIACAAGGSGSYMAPMGLANALMLDFQCVIVPRFVYTVGSDYQHDRLVNERARGRLHRLAAELLRIAGALKQSAEGKTPG